MDHSAQCDPDSEMQCVYVTGDALIRNFSLIDGFNVHKFCVSGPSGLVCVICQNDRCPSYFSITV